MKYTHAKKLEYESRWAAMVIKKKAQAEKVRDLILKGRKRYEGIQSQTGVPWEFVGLTHYRECACNWKGVLHNGQLIIGTGRKTTIVPKGYGPFDTWEEAALSALKRQGLDQNTDWSIGRMAYLLEGFNGYGYAYKGLPSPYLWGGSNQYIRGKYVADHVFDPNFVDPQMGCMPVLRLLQEANRIPSGQPLPGHTPSVPQEPHGPQPPVAAPPKKPPTAEGSVGLTMAGLWTWFVEHRWHIAALAVLVVSAYVLYRYIRAEKLSRTSPKAGHTDLAALLQQERMDQSSINPHDNQPEVAEPKTEESNSTADVVVAEVQQTVGPTEGYKP